MHHVSFENNNIDWMWLWWGCTVALCLWKLIEAVVFRPARMLEWPFLASAMWLYFFGFMAYKAKMTLSAYLGNGISEIGQLMDFLCLVGLLAGWAVGMRMPVRPSTPAQNYPYLLCWLAGMFFIGLGAIGNYSVSKAGDEGDLNFHTASAYWYLLYYVGYPGLAIALWAALKSKSPLKWVLVGITLAGLVAFMLPQVMNARRGPLFPAIIVLLLVPPMTMRRPPNRLLYCGGLAAAGMVMLLFVQIRLTIYNGGTWIEAFEKLDVNTAVVDRGDDAFDNEYVNNCQVIGTVFQNGKYDYGTGHLGLFLHWVPRQVWPAKPVLGEGIYANNEMFDDIEKATGVRLLGSGAAVAGVADSFVEYGVLCPFFWFFLSWLVGAIYLKAVRSGSPWWMFCYTGFLCSSHWLISQSFSASFVPGMYFQLIPLGVLAMVWAYRRLSAAPRKTGPRRTLSAPAVPSALPS
jgi:hypothetical protein